MKKDRKKPHEGEMLDEYDFSGGVRGKYYRRYTAGSNVVVIEPDLAKLFPDSRSVNRVLRSLVTLAEKSTKKKSRSR